MDVKRQITVKKIDALPLVRDIRAGLSATALMSKYGLSEEALQKIHGRIHKQSINLVESMVADIRSGVDVKSFLDKYNIPHDRLDSILFRLLENDAMPSDELVQWKNSSARRPTVNPCPASTRFSPSFPIVVCDLTDSANRGLIIDIDEHGLGTKGITSEKGKVLPLAVLGDEFGNIEPFEFNAVCRWTRINDLQGYAAGFQIEQISGHDAACLRKLLQLDKRDPAT